MTREDGSALRAQVGRGARRVERAVVRHGALFLFVLSFVAYFGQLDRKPSGDTYTSVYTAVAIVRDGSFRLDPYRPLIEQRAGVHPYQLAEGDDGHDYALFPIATALFAVPPVAVLTLAGVEPERWDVYMEAGMFTGAAVTAGAVALFFVLLTRLTTRRRALLVALIFALATPAWTIAGQGLWQHGPVLLALTAALLAIVERRWAAAGVALASMAVFRPSAAVMAIALLPLVLRSRKAAVRACFGALGPVLALAAYNTDSFGCPTCSGYENNFVEGKGFSGVLWHGLTGNLVSPGRGIFVYAPILLLSLAGMWLGRRTPLYRWASVALVAHVLVVSKWFEWWGGEAFGPRQLVDALPLFCLLLVPPLALLRRPLTYVLAVLVAWSFAVHLLGAALWPGTGWYDTHDVRSFGTWWHPLDSELTAFFEDPGRLLERGSLMLALVLAAVVAAIVAAIVAPDRPARPAIGDPHVVLALGLLAVLGLERLRGSATTGSWIGWPCFQALVAGTALLWAWREQERLRLGPLLALTALFQLGWLGLHLGLGVQADIDSATVYPAQGNLLLDGEYPASEYPPGAVLLFGLDAWLGGAETRSSHALVMVPFQLATVAGVWLLRTRWSAWLATVVAVWPLNAFFWELKFDLAPTAMLVAGLCFAWRGRWGLAGIALGAGTALKWAPSLAALALVVWLVASGLPRAAARHAIAFAVTFAAVHLPFLVWAPRDVLHAYTTQGGRDLTGESLPYLPLRLLGLASSGGGEAISAPASTVAWANVAALALQALVVLAGLLVAARVAHSRTAGVAVASLVPVLFLLTNRIFSPQWLVLMLAAWCVAAALLVRDRREQLGVAAAAATATLANTLVYPTLPHAWEAFSALLFAAAFGVTMWLIALALAAAREPAGRVAPGRGHSSAPSRLGLRGRG